MKSQEQILSHDLGHKLLQDFEKNNKNCLFLTDCGINNELLLVRFIKKYAINSRLMIILNVRTENSEYIVNNILKEYIQNTKINVSILTKKISKYRQKIYNQGGVIFLTSKIFVLDVLEGIICPDLVDFLITFQLEKHETNQFQLLYRYIKDNSNQHSKPTNCILFSRKLQFLIQDELNFTKLFQVNQMLWPYIRKEIQEILNMEHKICHEVEYCIEFVDYKKQIQEKLVLLRQNIFKKITQYYKIEEDQLLCHTIVKYGREAQQFYQYYSQIVYLFYVLCEQNLKVLYITIVNLINSISQNFHQFIGRDYSLLVDIASICRVNFFKTDNLQKTIKIQEGLELKHTIIFDFGQYEKFNTLLRILEQLEEQQYEQFQTQSTNKNNDNNLQQQQQEDSQESKIQQEQQQQNQKNNNINNNKNDNQQNNENNLQENEQQTQKEQNENNIFIFCDRKYKKEQLQTLIDVFYNNTINLKSFFVFNLSYFLQSIIDQKPVTNKLPFDTKILQVINDFLQYLIINDKDMQFYGENNNNIIDADFDIFCDDSQDDISIDDMYMDQQMQDQTQDNNDIQRQENKKEKEQQSQTQKIFQKQQYNNNNDKIDYTSIYNWKGGNNDFLNYIYIRLGDKQYSLKDIYENKFENKFKKILNIQIQVVNFTSTFQEKFENISKQQPLTYIFYDFCTTFYREIRILNELNLQQQKYIQEPFQVFQIYIKNSIQSQNHFEYLQSKKKTFDILLKNFSSIPKLDYEYNNNNNNISKNSKIVIVDKREFGSKIPIQLYNQGITVIPQQLDTADYILAPSIAIERKDCATGDLFSSLNSGRLRQQSRRMNKKFYNPYILIENYQKASIYQQNKLLSILRDFKNLQILWSKDEKQTIQFILHLKQNQQEPYKVQSKIKQFFKVKNKQF